MEDTPQFETASAQTFFDDGVRALANRDYSAAVDCFDQATTAEASSATVYKIWAEYHLAANKQFSATRAIGGLRGALREHPELTIAHLFLARLYRATDDRTSARDSYLEYLRQHPDDEAASEFRAFDEEAARVTSVPARGHSTASRPTSVPAPRATKSWWQKYRVAILAVSIVVGAINAIDLSLSESGPPTLQSIEGVALPSPLHAQATANPHSYVVLGTSDYRAAEAALAPLRAKGYVVTQEGKNIIVARSSDPAGTR